MRAASVMQFGLGLALLACQEKAPVRDEAITGLQVALMERLRSDQAIRDTVFGNGAPMDALAVARMQRVDADNTTWLKQQIRMRGWPSPAKVGKAAGDAAFLLVQHATHDPTFQRMILDTISLAFERGEVDGQSYALLFDRVRTQAGQKQRYGTQAKLVGKRIVFERMEDSARVNSLRKTVGLPSLEVYRRTLDSVYFSKAKPAPNPR